MTKALALDLKRLQGRAFDRAEEAKGVLQRYHTAASHFDGSVGMAGFKVLLEKNDLGKRGFSSCTIDVGEGKMMRCLRIHHPSMPRFGWKSDTTQSIISRFLETETITNGSTQSKP